MKTKEVKASFYGVCPWAVKCEGLSRCSFHGKEFVASSRTPKVARQIAREKGRTVMGRQKDTLRSFLPVMDACLNGGFSDQPPKAV